VRIAFIVQRYGTEILGGPEYACRLTAERLAERHDVDVLTTCARDARTWKNEYTEGADRIRGVLVRRFAVSQPHDAAALKQYTDSILSVPRSRAEEIAWSRRLGPQSNGLIDQLRRQHRSYDVIVFFSLMQPATVEGVQFAGDHSIVFPYLRMGPALRFSLWADLLTSVKGVGLLSEAERRLLNGYVGVRPRIDEVVGIGIDPPPQLSYPRHQQDPADTVVPDDEETTDVEEEPTYLSGRGVTFRRRHRLYGSFAMYGGRVEPDNGCEEMLEYYNGYADDPAAMPLVLMGVKMMKVPEQRHVWLGGVLPDRERMAAYESADVTIIPAADDLLAQGALESLAVGTPVLSSARNETAVGHLVRANAGLFYSNREEFAETLRMLAGNSRLREALGENGRNYVRQHYRWEHVLGRFERLVGRVRPR
jgi:glycosyltransferase involved in cell wall biosynthesis